MEIIKKDGTIEEFKPEKIVNAVSKSASRAMVKLTDEEKHQIVDNVKIKIEELELDRVTVPDMHNFVESSLDEINRDVAKSYRDYRNYKQEFVHILDKVYERSQAIRFIGDKENANTDSALVATKRCLIFNELNKRLYRKFFMTVDERQACREGYIYIHDQSARLDSLNCFSRSTRFITSTGVRSFYDFMDGDTVMVPTHLGNWKKATVRSYGWQKLQKVHLKRAAGYEKVVSVTVNHRWILKDGTETTNLKVGDKLVRTPDISSFNWDDLSRADKKMWCLGFAFGDGSLVKYNNMPTLTVRLCGHKIEYADRFRDVGYSVTAPESLNGDMSVIMTDIHVKEIPLLDLDYNNTKYFVNGFMSADGNRNISDNPTSEFRGVQITGSEENFLMSKLLNAAGYYITTTRDLTDGITNYGTRSGETKHYQCYTDSGDRTWVVTKIEPDTLNPKSQVWCLDVEDDHSFLLEGGIPTGNCCLFNISNVLDGGFEMGNVWYNEPKTLDTAFDVIGDIILSTASQQYGGFTVPEVDKILAKYAHKSYDKMYEKYYRLIMKEKRNVVKTIGIDWDNIDPDMKLKIYEEVENAADAKAMEDVQREFEQGFQGWEYKLNTVGSSRGDYPFITMTFGLSTDKFGKIASKTFLRVHMNGQGKKDNKKPVLFPKLVFLYDENLHGPGKELEDVFEVGIQCSSKTMYPDWLSLTGDGYVPEIYKKYGKVISPMGCRAFLSPWFERGGMEPADENDTPIFVGRFNIGAVSLNLPMILAKSRKENRDFHEVLDYYLEMIRQLHIRTYAYLGEIKASTNPVAFCEGGLYGGNLKPSDKIKPLLKAMTASFGITALNELQMLYNGKSLVEDGQFALDTLKYINDKINQFKKEDGNLYAIYGTPAENLCSLQVKQFRKIYGIVEGVSDREYVSNSFHCHVTEDITPIQKQNLENRFWNLSNGGKIQYVKYPIGYNIEAIKTLVRRAMKMGFYEGVNLSLAYCEDCGHQELEMDVCPKCGSKNLTKIDRMNGYLAYSRVHGDTRLNAGKMAEIKERVSM